MLRRKIFYECGCVDNVAFQTCPIHGKKILKILTINETLIQKYYQNIFFFEVVKTPVRRVVIEGVVKC